MHLLIVDDHKLVAQSLATSLGGAHTIVGLAHSGREAVDILEREGRVDAVLLDLALGTEDGLGLFPAIRAVAPRVRIVVVTMFDDAHERARARAAGADGFVPKDVGVDVLLEALETVGRGEPWFRERPGVPRGREGSHGLSPRQHLMLEYLAHGLTYKEIGEEIGLAADTIEQHFRRIREVLGARSNTDLVRIALTKGVIKPPPPQA